MTDPEHSPLLFEAAKDLIVIGKALNPTYGGVVEMIANAEIVVEHATLPASNEIYLIEKALTAIVYAYLIADSLQQRETTDPNERTNISLLTVALRSSCYRLEKEIQRMASSDRLFSQ